jgi:hypothetical protein
MPIYSVPDVASVGLVVDIDPVLLPPPAWSDARNVRFQDGAAVKFLGHSSLGTPSVTPYYLLPVIKGATPYWVYCGLDKVYAWDGAASHVNITRQALGEDVDYTGTAADRWNGGVFNGVLVLNNGVDDPQMFVSTTLESLTWDSGNTWAAKGYTCKALRPYRNFLVAMNWDDGSNEYPQQVYWSNRADPLSVPSDWDFADPANEAGFLDLASTEGHIVTGEQLRDSFVIYKEDAMHVMTEVGGTFVMEFRDLSLTTGLLAQRCAKEFYGRHFVLANDDVIVHDGQSLESVASKRIRRELFNAIDPIYYSNAYVIRNLRRNEMWCCFTETGGTLPTRAAVWNWKDNTWAHRDLPSMSHAGFGILPSAVSDSTTWDSDSQAWDADTTLWSSRVYNPAAQSLVGATAGDFFLLDNTAQFDAVNITSYVVREGILLDGQQTIKQVRTIYPRATGGAMQISIGYKFDADDNYVWEGPYTFTPGTDAKVDVRCTGRFHAIRFAFPGGTEGALHGYDIEYVPVGYR